MNKLRLASAIVVVTLCAILVLCLTLACWPRATDPASIALADPSLHINTLNPLREVKVGNITPLGEDGSAGYFRTTDMPERVPVQLGSLETLERYVVYVDANRSKVVGVEWYSRFKLPASLDVKIPPGDSWYYKLDAPVNTNDGTQVFTYSLRELSPANATVIPVIVDEANLFRMKNGSAWEAAEYVDPQTKEAARMNGTAPVYPGWRLKASVSRPQAQNYDAWPSYDTSHGYYLILKNEGKDEVEVVLVAP